MNNKKQAKSQLRSLLERYEKNRDEIMNKKNKYTEADARREFIDPFLEIFGWDISNKAGKSLSDSDVVTENMINKREKPDYLLRRNGSTFYTVEAEKPEKDIHKDLQPSTQVLRYGWSANNKIGLLFNFETFQIFQTYKKPDLTKPNKPWKSLEYTEFIANFDLLWKFLSVENVYNGTTDKAINKITPRTATKTSLDNYFLGELDNWRQMIGQDLVNSRDKKKYTDSKGNFKALNDDTQTFLNQIIFLRFAEDNQLEQHDQNELDYIFENSSSFSKKLNDLDKKYNSGIFEKSNIGDLLSPDTISTISESLYYPRSSYNFAVIDLGILGKIYEQFLQHELVYDADTNTVKLVDTPQAAIKAVVSTPIELTRLITRKALSKKLSNIQSIDQLLKLRIADISAGSGVFLVSAYDLLISKAIDLLHLRRGAENIEASLQIKKQLISQVLFGADIDYHASQITKFSLALRLLHGESPERFRGQLPIIPSLDKNIKSQNSLISKDDISNLLRKRPELLNDLSDDEIDVINPNSGDLQHFDVILGNPPYLNTEEMIASSKLEFELYKSKFSSAYKQFDKYYLFLEQMLSQLKPDGTGTFITPNKFVSIGAGTKLREVLLNHISSMIDFGATQLFSGKDTYVAIITVSQEKYTKLQYAEARSLNEAISPNFIELDTHEMVDENSNWLLTNNKETLELYKKTKDFPRITDGFSVHVGVQTSRTSVYLIKNKELLNSSNDEIIRFKKHNKIWNIEKSITKPFFKNINHKGTYYAQPETDSIIIFPYTNNGKLISSEKLQKDFPLCWNYLNFYKKELLPKNLGGKRDVRPKPNFNEWYVYGRSHGLTGWDKEKLIVGVMSNKPSTAYDSNHMLLASGGTAGYIPIFQGTSDYALEYAEAWMNYPAIDEMFKMLSTSFRGGYWTHGEDMLALVPFLTIDKDDPKQVKLYEDIVKYIKRINSSSNKSTVDILVSTVNNMLNELVKLRIG
ncbi:Eco57I restriction-modification methylase domain-containing protein [Limosilactobacillus reuteri]|uniref:Eco57I restriction-modification methylase domain-containing protein n=1 Tax=Limosilactobacillus reuteri TaxID=1598 RepID=UPI001E41B3AA|nr:N-6 DNA methylase [Limosilactobacillus reuteri]MCC4414489.1 Eco57I restriction-modification methylase domain-containing protein [Limosilactobacillus reuteri]